MVPILKATGLSKRFKDVRAVAQVSLELNRGESFALLGPDGAGKSTTLRLLCGALEPDAGEVVVGNFSLATHLSRAQELIGYMPQHFSLYETLTVDQNIAFFANLYGVSREDRERRAGELLAMSRLDPFRSRLAGHLSGGMKQKLALICTVIHQPPILLLDEPTTGVDPVSRRDFWKILHRFLTQGIALLISTPYMDEAERCQRIGLMHQGHLIRVDTPDRLKSQELARSFEIQSTSSREIGKALEAQALSIQSYTDRVRVLMPPGTPVSHIEARLREAGFSSFEIVPVPLEMEDVFVLMTLRHGLETGGA